MPNTLQYRPKLIDKLITNERIGSYHAVFNTKNDIELMGVYLWNAHVCGVIYPLISLTEITLRNSIDQALTAHLGKFWWAKGTLKYNSFVSGEISIPHSVKKLRENFDNASEAFISEQKRRHGVKGKITPTHHGIIAKTDFSTWEFILDDEFMGNSRIWPSRLGTVFAGTWPNKKTKITLQHSKNLVKTIRNFRNRISHHEPAWKYYGVRDEADAIQHLHEKIGKIEELIKLIDPENHKLLQKNWLLENAYRACSSQEIHRFKHLTKNYDINSIEELKIMLETCLQENSVLKAKFDGNEFLITPINS